MGIGSILQKLIDDNNTNVVEVSKATGVAATTIYSIIRRDSKSANISDLAKIAHHLGVTLDFFYENEKDDNLSLSAHEKKLILAYRQNPNMQTAVDTLLNLDKNDDELIAADIMRTVQASQDLLHPQKEDKK